MTEGVNYDYWTAGKYLATLPIPMGTTEPSIFLESDTNSKAFKATQQNTEGATNIASTVAQNQYFKVRLTSKKTGRKVDVNLRFRRNHNETKEEEESFKNWN